MFPEKRKDGSWIKKIVFNFPVPVDGEEVKELPLETETTVETVVLLSQLKQKPDDYINVTIELDDMDITSAETKACLLYTSLCAINQITETAIIHPVIDRLLTLPDKQI